MEPPTRTHTATHQCVCTIVNHDGTMRDSCHARVENPDQPFCNFCESVGHPDIPQQSPRIG